MNQSTEITELSKALAIFQSKAVKIIKKADNPFFKSKYADLASILDEIAQPLKDSGLVITQWPDADGLTTMLIHAESGQYLSSNATMHPAKSDPQSIGSAITYQRRYSIVSILALNCDEDDDGNKASEPKAANPGNKPATPATLWLNEGTEQWEKAVAYMAKSTDKQAAVKSLRASYSISKATEAKLLAL